MAFFLSKNGGIIPACQAVRKSGVYVLPPLYQIYKNYQG